MRALQLDDRSRVRPIWLRGPCNGDLHIAQSFRSYSTIEEKLEVTLGSRLAFPASKSNSVETAYISSKNLRYTFDKSAEKIDGRVLVPSPHVEAYDFLGFVEHFILKLSTTTFPLRCTGQASMSIDEKTCFV